MYEERMPTVAWFEGEPLVRRIDAESLAADIDEVLADQRRLVRKLDVLLNGKSSAASQASLCDIVTQVQMLVTPK